ncbi:hypothetical protein IC582_006953 [Cucumis melo]|uniref:Uncharacterized protein LOC103503567 isoform X2 n=2 Tax=Cucumis melo TaxID=3656 RepID=A0A1S3CQJ2_CUCME|nr:uncharacterized protein LOC103503567 isoform X2 [Cucumis melo]KAA0038558.1 hypothetical protein E6C27_scaffold92G00860 [Cucumis melo var. makuwa]TYK31184.1 hypothetical protein E5676_scaffold455G004680 [Cucumis melo var. makuwa]
MQRQSLGSPVSKLHGHGAGAKSDEDPADDQKRKKHSPSSSSILNYGGQDDDKSSKSFRFSFPSPSPPRQEKLVHAIPILTIICFLILYIFSHSPSQSDLAQFHGFKRPSQQLEIKADDGHELILPKKGNILAIQSFRNLKEIEKSHSLKSRPPRKLADF